MNICFYPRIAGRLLLNLVRRLHQDILDWVFAVKQSWFNCGQDENPTQTQNATTGGPSRREKHVNNNNDSTDSNRNSNSDSKRTSSSTSSVKQKTNYEVSVTKMAWFHSVNRERAVQMVAAGGEGCFLVRPSSSKEPLTLTLWYGGRAYNIFIRKRDDNKIGLGTFKPNEVAFDTVEELVNYYQTSELILYSDGHVTGRTKLGGFPA
uniref:SH2 domain-containing protein n=2 Tax=Cacopsylla melanoneura TaxID=428564 RepID=A0A8D8XTC5_9HEMI